MKRSMPLRRSNTFGRTRHPAHRGRAWLRGSLVTLLLLLATLQSAQAHRMPAQRGTLNIVGDGAYMVLFMPPVAGFAGIDDNGDGALSVAEMRAHGAAIEAQIRQGVLLADRAGAAAARRADAEPVTERLCPSAGPPKGRVREAGLHFAA